MQSDRHGNLRASGQITSKFLTQVSWGLCEIRQPPTCLCATSIFLTNAMVIMVKMVNMVVLVIMVTMVILFIVVIRTDMTDGTTRTHGTDRKERQVREDRQI